MEQSSLEQPSIEPKERRITRRYQGSITCRFSCPRGGYSGVLKNVSIDGAFVEAEKSPPVDSRGDLVVESRNGLRLRLPARVVYSSSWPEIEGFGLYFLHFNKRNLALLEALTAE